MEEGQRENEPAEDNDRPEVTGRRRRDVGAKQPARYGGPEAECQLEGPAPFRDEIVAWVIAKGRRALGLARGFRAPVTRRLFRAYVASRGPGSRVPARGPCALSR